MSVFYSRLSFAEIFECSCNESPRQTPGGNSSTVIMSKGHRTVFGPSVRLLMDWDPTIG